MYRIGSQNFSSLSTVPRTLPWGPQARRPVDGWSVSLGPVKISNEGVNVNAKKAVETVVTGGANYIIQGATGKDIVGDISKTAWSATKRIAKYGENIMNIPAGWVNAGIKKVTPDSWNAYIDMFFPTRPVVIPTSWSEFKAEYKKQLPIAQMILRNCGPWGMAASAALGVIGVMMEGGSLEDMAWAAVEGASPTYVQMAVAAVRAVVKGGSFKDMATNAALDAGSKYFDSAASQSGFAAAKVLINGGNMADAAIAAAREQAKTMGAEALKAFNVAVDAVKTIAAGGDAKDIALTVAMNAGSQYITDPTMKAGFDVAKKIVAGDSPKDIVLAEARKKLTPAQQKGFDQAVAAANTVRAGGSVNVALDAGATYFVKGTDAEIGFSTAKQLVADGKLDEANISTAKSKLSANQKLGFDAAIGMITREMTNTKVGQPSAMTVAGKAVATAAVTAQAGGKAITPPPAKPPSYLQIWSQEKCKGSTITDCADLWYTAGTSKNSSCKSKTVYADYVNCMKSVAMPTQVLATNYARSNCKNETGYGYGACMTANYTVAEKYSKVCATSADPTKCVSDNSLTSSTATTKTKTASIIKETHVEYNKMLWIIALGSAAVIGGTFFVLRK